MKKSLRFPLYALTVIILLLVVLHFSLGHIARYMLNQNMAEMGEYTGEVEQVDVYWWMGSYRIHDLNIRKLQGDIQVPFLRAPLIDIAISWPSLLHKRALVAEVVFTEPELNFVDGETDADRQTGRGVDWRERLREQVLIEIDMLRVDNGLLAFRNFTSEPEVNVYASDVNFTVRDLTTARTEQGERSATLEGTADFLDHAPLEVEAAFDPMVRMEDFDFRLRVTQVQLPELNDFASAYGKFDFNAGRGELVLEVEASEGELTGYIKPLLHEVEIFDYEQDIKDQDKGLFRGIWEAVVDASESLLRNREEEQFATRVNLRGSLQDAEISPMQAFFGILRNGFVEAFRPGFEGSEVEPE